MGLGTLRAVLRKGSNFGAAWSTVNATSGLCGACNNFMIHKLVVDVDGNLYVAGNAIQNGVSYNWYVRSSNDQGANWITKSFTTNPYPWGANGTNSFYINPSGTFFICASTTSNFNWNIFRSVNSGTSWTLVDDYAHPGSTQSECTSMIEQSDGSLLATGQAYLASGNRAWVTRKSTDGGATWVSNFSYTSPSYVYTLSTGLFVDGTSTYLTGFGSHATGFAQHGYIILKSTNQGGTWALHSNIEDPYSLATAYAGDRYTADKAVVVGESVISGGSFAWLSRRSVDNGQTWSTVDSYQLSAGYAARAQAVGSANGSIIVVGSSLDAGSISHWIVRKSSDSGASWTTVDDYSLVAGGWAYATGVAFKDADIYVVGVAYDAANLGHFLIRKSSDGGASWSIALDYLYDPAKSSFGLAVSNCGGTMFAGGTGTDNTWLYHGVVLKEASNGTWAAVDDFQLNTNQGSEIMAMSCNSTGLIATAGYGYDPTGSFYQWFTRKSSTAGTSWTTIDNFNFSAAIGSVATSVLVDDAGVIFVGGRGGSGSRTQGVIRKSSDNGASWINLTNPVISTPVNSQSEHSSLFNAIIPCFDQGLCSLGSSEKFSGEKSWWIQGY